MKSHLLVPLVYGLTLPVTSWAQQPAPTTAVVPAVVEPAKPAATEVTKTTAIDPAKPTTTEAPAAPAPVASPVAVDPLAKVETELTELRAALVKQRDTLKLAIARAERLGQIRKSTGATHRSLLEAAPVDGNFFELARLQPPPQVEGADDLNGAWSAFKQQTQDSLVRLGEINERVVSAVVDALQEAARTGDRPEALDNADKLIAGWNRLIQPNRSATSAAPFSTSTRELAQRIANDVRAVLTAYRDQDAPGLITAFTRATVYRTEGRTVAALRPDAFFEELRQRCSEPFSKAAVAAQRKVEEQVIQGATVEKTEEAITDFLTRSQVADRLRELGNRGYNVSYTRQGIINMYRNAALMQDLLKGENFDTFNSSLTSMQDDTGSPVSAEFRKFHIQLSQRISERQRKAGEVREARRVAMEKENREKAETALKAALEDRRKKLAEELKTVQTPEALFTLANNLLSSSNYDDRGNYSGLQAELRMIAGYWLDHSPQVSGRADRPGLEYRYEVTHPFGLEVRALRERVAREVGAKRLNLPQLKEAPLANLPVSEAMEKLAREAADKADWKQCFAILRYSPSSAASAEQLEAIRAYLVGQNLENAGQYREAVESYKQVIRTIADAIPTKEAAERLKALKEEHPEPVTEKVVIQAVTPIAAPVASPAPAPVPTPTEVTPAKPLEKETPKEAAKEEPKEPAKDAPKEPAKESAGGDAAEEK